MRRLTGIYPEYAEQVAFYAVAYDADPKNAGVEGAGGTLGDMERKRQEEGWPWPVAVTDADALKNLGIVWWGSKLAFDPEGVIIYRDGYGSGREDVTWREVFTKLVQQS